jgi:hypothetical protein
MPTGRCGASAHIPVVLRFATKTASPEFFPKKRKPEGCAPVRTLLFC